MDDDHREEPRDIEEAARKEGPFPRIDERPEEPQRKSSVPKPAATALECLAQFVIGLLGTGFLIAAVTMMGADFGAAKARILWFLLMPSVGGPITGGVIWYLTRKQSQAFGIGAIIAGLVPFLVLGPCLSQLSR